MLMPASPHNPITHASIKAAILYNFSTQYPKRWYKLLKIFTIFKSKT